MSQYWADLEQQEYDPDEFVERLAFRFVEAASRGLTLAVLGSQSIVIKVVFNGGSLSPMWKMFQE